MTVMSIFVYLSELNQPVMELTDLLGLESTDILGKNARQGQGLVFRAYRSVVSLGVALALANPAPPRPNAHFATFSDPK